ncbi:metallophosphoesterase [Chitinophaga agrisoli]|uniref:Metallophosphoesterase n=1 Tax=Chitinophaga agrisoli TaxID=2607653 RepID=A0A5B2VN98_9BACT|nr:metallophosphoesterase [Chitinophaga agrisoli]KAA2240178.1 metallophosphoesterase [Chitinophaga agrisoli]
MKRFLIFCLLIVVLLGKGLAERPNIVTTDGPYVFYLKDSIEVREIVDSNGRLVPVKSLYFNSEKPRIKLNVPVVGNPKHGFAVSLKDIVGEEPSVFPNIGKMLIVSDIEGEFEGFRQLMISNKVMDSLYNWTFGSGHLIICGDLFDRGQDVAAYLWLLYELEGAAKVHGGYVHVLLGNHDIMNLSGDWRYVEPKYFEQAAIMGKDYSELYADRTELGKWLRSKNIIEKVGDYLFLHGGISPELLKKNWRISEINSIARPYYGINSANIPDSLRVLFDGETSPFWYRGYFEESAPTSLSEIERTLSLYNCKYIVIGHTIVDEIKPLYGGKVFAVDVNHHKGVHQALLIENGKPYMTDSNGNLTEWYMR